MVMAYEEAYKSRFGFTMEDKQIIVATVSVEAIGSGDTVHHDAAAHVFADEPVTTPLEVVKMYCGNAWVDTPVFQRETLPAEWSVEGPALIVERTGTNVIEKGWCAYVSPLGNLLLKRSVPREGSQAVGTQCNPIMLEVFSNLFMSIAEQMGYALQNSALSVNIKERLDFSCAIFDHDQNLVSNAPHMAGALGVHVCISAKCV